MIKRLMSSRI